MRRALPALLLVAALVAACGTSKTHPPAQSAPGVSVRVSADWGAEPVAAGRANPGTVIDATRAVGTLTTSYGGRYVTGIDGKGADDTRDWIFWVNGIEAPAGAADTPIAAGDRVWWDLHLWNGRVHVPAVIAEWPMPLTRSLGGSVSGLSADPPLAAALHAAGVRVAQPAAPHGPRAIVGSARELQHRDALWRRAVANPDASGLTAWIDAAGATYVWNAERGTTQLVPRATAVIVATTDGFAATDPPVVIVVGTTHGAALSAAQLLADNPDLVRNATALCLDAAGTVVCRGGSGLVP